MDDFKDDFGKDEQIQVRALSSGTVDIPEVYGCITKSHNFYNQ